MPNPLKIDRSKTKVIEFDIDGKIYKVPLGTSLKRQELAEIRSEEGGNKFFEKHLGADLWNDLTVGEQRQITQAWSDATQEDCGITPGESSASRSS